LTQSQSSGFSNKIKDLKMENFLWIIKLKKL
jgi:hypothetical protein